MNSLWVIRDASINVINVKYFLNMFIKEKIIIYEMIILIRGRRGAVVQRGTINKTAVGSFPIWGYKFLVRGQGAEFSSLSLNT